MRVDFQGDAGPRLRQAQALRLQEVVLQCVSRPLWQNYHKVIYLLFGLIFTGDIDIYIPDFNRLFSVIEIDCFLYILVNDQSLH